MDHTVLPANYTIPAFCFARIHQIAPPLSEVECIWWELNTHLSAPKGWKAELACSSGWFAHVVNYLSATGRAQDREVHRRKADVIPWFHATNQRVRVQPAAKRFFVHLQREVGHFRTWLLSRMAPVFTGRVHGPSTRIMYTEPCEKHVLVDMTDNLMCLLKLTDAAI